MNDFGLFVIDTPDIDNILPTTNPKTKEIKFNMTSITIIIVCILLIFYL